MKTDSRHKQIQCCYCGNMSDIEGNAKLRDEIYIDSWCVECGHVTPHLDVGEGILNYYLNYDPMLDDRFFRYNTK